MRVITLVEFNDKKCNVKRREGDVFTVSKERYAEIMAYRSDLIKAYEAAPTASKRGKSRR